MEISFSIHLHYLTTSIPNTNDTDVPATDPAYINILLTIHCNFPNTLFAVVGY